MVGRKVDPKDVRVLILGIMPKDMLTLHDQRKLSLQME